MPTLADLHRRPIRDTAEPVAARRRDARRGDASRQHDHEGLSEERRGDAVGVRARLVPHRRSRRLAPDGYIEIKDRSKDIIISGGENISSLEVEECLYRHPQVMEAAVVARPDAKWGESPCAFVTLKPALQVNADEIVGWCRERIARFKVPKTVVFGPLPKTATGKIQKYVLRERARALPRS